MARHLLQRGAVIEPLTLEKCAAYAAACATLAIVHRAAFAWPPDVADRARSSAVEVVMAIAHGVGHLHGSQAREVCLYEARRAALDLCACIDVAIAMRDPSAAPAPELAEGRELASKVACLLVMFTLANSLPIARG